MDFRSPQVVATLSAGSTASLLDLILKFCLTSFLGQDSIVYPNFVDHPFEETSVMLAGNAPLIHVFGRFSGLALLDKFTVDI